MSNNSYISFNKIRILQRETKQLFALLFINWFKRKLHPNDHDTDWFCPLIKKKLTKKWSFVENQQLNVIAREWIEMFQKVQWNVKKRMKQSAMQSDDMNCQSISQIFSSSLVGEQSNKPKIVPIIQKHFGWYFTLFF